MDRHRDRRRRLPRLLAGDGAPQQAADDGTCDPSLDKLIQLISAGRLVSLAGDWVEPVFRRDGIAFVPVPDAGPLVIALGWRTSHLTPPGARLLELARAMRDRESHPRGARG